MWEKERGNAAPLRCVNKYRRGECFVSRVLVIAAYLPLYNATRVCTCVCVQSCYDTDAPLVTCFIPMDDTCG